jgi:hypothetical protein
MHIFMTRFQLAGMQQQPADFGGYSPIRRSAETTISAAWRLCQKSTSDCVRIVGHYAPGRIANLFMANRYSAKMRIGSFAVTSSRLAKPFSLFVGYGGNARQEFRTSFSNKA